MRVKACICLAILLAVGTGMRARAAAGPACDESLSAGIPGRPEGAPGGRAFAATLQGMTDDERETAIRHELAIGNIPGFLRHLSPVRLPVAGDDKESDIVICAAPDYLAIGSDGDFLLTPMRLSTALATASEFGFTLPTPRMVDAIYQQATVHFVPQPLPASAAMRSTDYSVRHNALVGAQRSDLGASLGALIAGDKKDLVLTNRLWDHPDRVAIYGWQLPGGRPIQPLSTVHGWRYADYSHGVRLVSTRIYVGGRSQSIFAAMQDTRLARALSNEGVITDVIGLIKTLNQQVRVSK